MIIYSICPLECIFGRGQNLIKTASRENTRGQEAGELGALKSIEITVRIWSLFPVFDHKCILKKLWNFRRELLLVKAAGESFSCLQSLLNLQNSKKMQEKFLISRE